MALRLYSEFPSYLGTDWRIEIHDTDFVGSETEFTVSGGFSLNPKSDGREFTEALMPTELTVNMVITDPDETFKDDIVTSSETRFSVVLLKDSDFYWAGALVPDIGEIEDKGPTYGMTIKAVCGLGLLADYEYIDETPTADKWTNTFSGFERLIGVIALCLKKLPHIQTHYAASNNFLKTVINWHHSGQPFDDPDNTNDPLYNVYVLQSVFSGIQTTGNAKPMSCAAVIEAILDAFNARIVQVNGLWLVEQYETRTRDINVNPDDNRARRYNYDIDPPTATGINPAFIEIDPGNTTRRRSGGSFGYAKAAKEVFVRLDTKTRYNLTEAMRFNESSASDYNAGNVFWDGTASTFRAKGTISGNLENISIPPIVFGINVTLVYRLKVNLQSNYLDQTLTYSGSVFQGVVTKMAWDGSPAYIEIPIDVETLPAIGDTVDFSKEFDFTISTPAGTQGNLSVFFEFDRLVNRQTGATVSGMTYGFNGWDLKDPYFAIYYDEDIAQGAQAYQVINTEYVHSATIKKNTILGDAVGLNDRGALRYLDGSDYLATLDWSVRDDVDGYTISELMGRRILQAQSTPRRVINATLFGPSTYQYDLAIEYEGVRYLFMGGEFRADRDELSGTWIELNYEDVTMTTAINADTDSPGSPPTTTGTVNQNTGGTLGGGGGSPDGNGIYTGSGIVPDATTADLDGTFTIQRSGATTGEGFFVVVDDGTDTNEIQAKAATGVRLISTGDIITFEGETAFADVISGATLNADANDYAAGDGANVLRLTASTAVNITGIAGGSAGRILFLYNVGSNNITLANANTSSSAANRFDIGKDFTIRASHGAAIQYDATSSRWRIAAAHVLGRWEEAYTTSTATTASLSVTSPATNIGAAIVPKGNGALTLAIPDGASTGGNARGTKAVDLQIDRISASQVASGTSSGIFAGRRNLASGTYATVLGGSQNTASAEGACSVGGQLNAASGQYSSTICGNGNTASGVAAATLGGASNEVTADYSTATGGVSGSAYLYSQRTLASGSFTAVGDAQKSELVMRRRITGTSQSELFLDGSSTQAILPGTNRVWNFRVDVVGVCDTAGNGIGIAAGEVWASWHCGVIKRISTTTSIVGSVQNMATAQMDTSFATTVVTIDADDSTEALRVRITPPTTTGSTTVCRWVATIHLSEIGY